MRSVKDKIYLKMNAIIECVRGNLSNKCTILFSLFTNLIFLVAQTPNVIKSGEQVIYSNFLKYPLSTLYLKPLR